MSLLSFRRVLYLCGFVGLFGFTAYLAQDDWFTRQKFQSLSRESAELKATLETIEAKHRINVADLLKEKGDFRDALGRLQKENADLRQIIDHIRDSSKQALDEKAYLEEILINKTKENERLRKSPGYSGTAWSGDSSELVEELKKKEKDLQTLEEQNRLLTEKLEKLYRTTSDKISEINVAKIALEETVASAKDRIDQEWNTVNLGAISSKGEPVPAARTAPTRVPRTEGKILAINDEHGFVVVDLGKVDNLKTEEELQVIQNGQTVATLSVLEIRDVMAACNIRAVADGGKIQINDPVSIRQVSQPSADAPVVNPIF